MSDSIQAQQIRQATTQAFRRLYIQKTMLVMVRQGTKRILLEPD